MLSDTEKNASFFETSQATARLSFRQDSTKMMIVENWWNDTDSGNWSSAREKCYSATLSTTNLTVTDLESNRHLRGERPATDHLSHDTAETRGSHVSHI
jgi:hypothetical protein